MIRQSTRAWSRGAAGVLLASTAFATGTAHAQSVDDTATRTACALVAGPTHAVTRVIDGETLTLDNGSEVRLIGALSPRPPDITLDAAFWPPERDAKTALEALVLGRSITLAFSGRRADRYGRTLAHVFVAAPAPDTEPTPAPEVVPMTPPATPPEPVWVQAHMIAHGHARAYALKDNLGCLRELSQYEDRARVARTGLWAHAAYQIRDGARSRELMQHRSTFQLVEGIVTSVIQGRTALILRFDDDGARSERERQPADEATRPLSRGFSIAVKTTIARAWVRNGLTLADLEGHRLRVHGWIERRGGPVIDILDAHQIELAENVADTAAVTPSVTVDTPPQPPRKRNRKGRLETAARVQTQNQTLP